MSLVVAAASVRHGAWLCLLLSWVCLLLPVPGLARLLGVPLALIAFVLALAVIFRAGLGAGWLLLLMSLFVTPLIFVSGIWLLHFLGLSKAPAPHDSFSAIYEEAGTLAPVSALDLLLAYEHDVADANRRYQGRRLWVVSSIQSIDASARGEPILRLGEPGAVSSVRAVGLEAALTMEMRPGQTVELICTGAGDIVGVPRLSDCQLAR